MKEFIAQVFDAYCKVYGEALNTKDFQPWTEDRKTIHESNQVRTFLEAYKSIEGNVITWMELPIAFKGEKQKAEIAHIDGFIVDFNNKRLVFIEAKRFSRPSQIKSINKDIQRLYNIREEIYVGDGQFKGLNLFDFDAYIVCLADIWEDRSAWTKNLVKEMNNHNNSGILCSPEYIMKDDIKEIFPMYHVTYTLAPYFNADTYRKELAATPKKKRKIDPSLLVWADEVGFESLLAEINQSGKK